MDELQKIFNLQHNPEEHKPLPPFVLPAGFGSDDVEMEAEDRGQGPQLIGWAWRWSLTDKMSGVNPFVIKRTAIDGKPVYGPVDFDLLEFVKAHVGLRERFTKLFEAFVFQVERTVSVQVGLTPDGASGGWFRENYHYQGYARRARNQKIRATAILKEFPECQWIQFDPASSHGMDSLRRYCMKEDTRHAGPWGDPKFTLSRKLDQQLEDKALPWHARIFNSMKELASPRTVNFLSDPQGFTAKSLFRALASTKMDQLVFTCGDLIDSKDMRERIVTAGGGKRLYVFDIGRSKSAKASWQDLYSVVEAIKSGKVTKDKHEAVTVDTRGAHVWVLMNAEVKETALSQDRYRMWDIDGSTLDFTEECVARNVEMDTRDASRHAFVQSRMQPFDYKALVKSILG